MIYASWRLTQIIARATSFHHLFSASSAVTAVKLMTMASWTSSRPSSDMAAFRKQFAKVKNLVVLTGAGVSAESGVPTFRGAGGFWRKWQAQMSNVKLVEAVTNILVKSKFHLLVIDLATPEAFAENPSLVWEFYHYRREVMITKNPNKGHLAIAECEQRLEKEGRHVVVITQNIDELHLRAGSKNVIELHGSLFKVRCVKCGSVTVNRDSPICPALKDKGSPNKEEVDARIAPELLPRCGDCGGMLRPHVVWFGEALDEDVLQKTHQEMDKCDLCLVVGTSSVVYPAAMFGPQLAHRGVTVAEFNMEETPCTGSFGFHFQGPSGVLLPEALAPV